MSKDKIIEQICNYNGYTTDAQISEILRPSTDLSAKDFADVDAIARELLFADKIIVHGDYDADGITACAVVQQFLPNAEFFIPERSDGYGLSMEFLETVEPGTTVLTVDCGISAVSQVQYAQSKGINVIITDHHNPNPNHLPEGVPIVNPKLGDNKYHGLSGAGVAYLLFREIYGENNDALQYAAIGTIADIMPVIGPNRAIITRGLEWMRSKPHVALEQLVRRSGAYYRKITDDDIAWKIGPMINACGRMGDAALALRYFTGALDVDEYELLAKEINTLNEHRKKLTEELSQDVLATGKVYGDIHVFWLEGSAGHGALGLIATKLVKQVKAPVVVLFNSGELVVGSARGPSWFDCYDLVVRNRGILSSGGGHKGAAGFSFEAHKTNLFLNSLVEYSVEPVMYKTEDVVEHTKLPILLDTSDAEQFAYVLEDLRPYGPGFEKPYCIVVGKAENIKTIGKTQKHLRFDINGVQAVYFDAADKIERLASGTRDFLCHVGINRFAKQENVQLEIKDFQ